MERSHHLFDLCSARDLAVSVAFLLNFVLVNIVRRRGVEQLSAFVLPSGPSGNLIYPVYVLLQASWAFVTFVGLFHKSGGYHSWNWSG